MNIKKLNYKILIPALAALSIAAGLWQVVTWTQDCFGSVTTQAMIDTLGNAFQRVSCVEVVGQTTATPASTLPVATATKPAATSTATKAVTATPTTRGATPTKPAATNTPVVPSTPVPGATATATKPTPTLLPGVTPTVIPPVLFCKLHENKWHPPLNEPCMHHTHGVNMRSKEVVDLLATYGFDVLEWLDENGDLWQPAWASSPLEFVDHAAGFIWLNDVNLNCDQFEGGTQDFSKESCIVYSLERIHDDGGAVHFLNRFHSLSSIRVICSKNAAGNVVISPATCGVVAAGMLGDSGEAHTPYKTAWCQIPFTDSEMLSLDNPPDLLNGGLYRANQTQDGRGLLFQAWWFQQANQVDKYLYPNDPNAGYALTWISHTWQVFDPTVCGTDIATMKAEAAKFPVSPNGGHNLFQIFNARTFYHVPVPFNGFTDRWGHVILDGSCSIPSLSCIPLQIVGNYPKGTDGLSMSAVLQRRFEDGDCVFAPCISFDTGGVTLLPPWVDAPPK